MQRWQTSTAAGVWAGVVLIALTGPVAPRLSAGVGAGEDDQYLEAAQAFNERAWDEARQAFLKFQKAFPRSRWEQAVKIRLADLEADPAVAEKIYRDIIRTGADKAWGMDARWSLANLLLSLGRTADAVTELQTVAADDDPRRAHAYYLLGMSHLARADMGSGKAALRRVTENYPDSAWAECALSALGDAELADHQPCAAAEAYHRLLKQYPAGSMADHARERLARLDVKTAGGAGTPAAVQATPAPTAVGGEKTPAAGTGDYAVQVGAFGRKEFAQTLVKRLHAKGYHAYVVSGRTPSGALLLQVRVGMYEQRKFAEDIAQQLAQREKVPTLVLLYAPPSTGE